MAILQRILMSVTSWICGSGLLWGASLFTGVAGAVTVSGSGGTGIPHKQALTLGCSYTVTPGDVVTGFTWRRVEDRYTVDIASGSVPAQTAVFQNSWQTKGVFVGNYNSSLDIQLPASHVTSSYAGTYRCEVDGLSGTVHATTTASVLTRPSISGLPSTSHVNEASILRIDCSTYTTAGNHSITKYKWTYGGSTVSPGAVLDRRNISRSQGGDYTCTASNSQGADSASVSVDVQYGPGTSVTITPSGSVDRVEGSGGFTATCTAVCNPNCTITWRKDNSDLPSGQISISNVFRVDQGEYTCQAQNGIGAPQQKSIRLVVYYLDPPRLTFNRSEVMENDTVTVDCDVDSSPTVEMTVTNVDNNTVLVQKTTNTLTHTIQRAQCLHNGSFVCSADNRKTGTIYYVKFSINVLCSPRHDFRRQLNSLVAQDKGTTAYLTADIIANPLPNFTWYRHDGGSASPIRNTAAITVTSTGLQSVLKIYISSDDDYGEYAVDVQNSVGQTKMVFTLSSETPPSEPTSIQVLSANPTSVSLKWITGYNGGSDQKFTLQYRSVSHWTTWMDNIEDPGKGQQITADITGLTPSTGYTFQVYGVNAYGEGERVKIQVNTTDEPLKSYNDGVTMGVGIGLGVCVPVIFIIVIVSIIVYRKLWYFIHTNKGKEEHDLNEMTTPQVQSSQHAENLYDGLDDDTGMQTYTQLRTYGTTRASLADA